MTIECRDCGTAKGEEHRIWCGMVWQAQIWQDGYDAGSDSKDEVTMNPYEKRMWVDYDIPE